jgi:two-component system, OmpR family, sensor kinase
VVNLGLMYVLPGAETIPFHLVWIGLSILYGLAAWRPAPTVAVLTVVALATGGILVRHAAAGEEEWAETTEVPLMTAVFAVMVWHVRRRQQMTADVARLAAAEHRRAVARDRFVQLASHELRTPITIARGYTELIRAASTDEGMREDARIVLEELDRVAAITQRLVTLVQLEDTARLTVGDVDAALTEVVQRWRPAADRRWTVRSSVGLAAFNPDRLKAALDCLVENAIKFTAPGDRVELIGTGAGDSWTVAVVDSGRGMSAECVAALSADEDSAVPPPTTSGTGLGMAIVRAVVRSRGGCVAVHSEPGKGTTVTLHFPRFTAPAPVITISPAAVPRAAVQR